MMIQKRIVAMVVLIMSIGIGGVAQDMNSTKASQPVDSGFIDVDGGKLFYEMTGDGDVIVMIHDGLIHREGWDAQFKHFSETNRVVRYDRRGYGRSPKPEAPYSDVEDLNRVFEALHIEKAALIGASAGGRLSIDFTLKYPDKVTMLILAGAVVSGMPFTNHFFTRGGHRGPEIVAGTEEYLNFWVEGDPYELWSGNKEAKERVRELLFANPQNADPGNYRYPLNAERPAVRFLDEIKVPTIIIVGEFDIPDVHAHAGAIEAGIPGARRIIIPNAGHLVAMEQPEEFNNVIVSTIGELKFNEIESGRGVAAAVEAYRKAQAAGDRTVCISENLVNQMGYRYLFNGNVENALILFELNVEAYPQSFNVFDSYGEALLAHGDTTRAVENYKKSLELNPNNTNAVQVLKTVGRE